MAKEKKQFFIKSVSVDLYDWRLRLKIEIWPIKIKGTKIFLSS